MTGSFGPRLGRSFFERASVDVAPDLLGRVLVAGTVAVRLTEVEAYAGELDPASHAYRGSTPRTAVMFGPAGHLYLYFVYGMHWCANIVTGQAGIASAVLLRAGEVVAGEQVAQSRRPAVERHFARGPAALTKVLGLDSAANGIDLCSEDTGSSSSSEVGGTTGPSVGLYAGAAVAEANRSAGPRVGVSSAAEIAWRFWVTGDPTVSTYRAANLRRR